MDITSRKRVLRQLRRPVFIIMGLSIVASVTLSIIYPDKGIANLKAVKGITIDILMIFPAVIVIMGVIAVWIRPEAVERYMGKDSGATGMAASMGLGLFSSLPIFMAFPMGNMLYNKGARLGNVFAFFGALAFPFPVLIIEAQFMGMKWMAVRLALTVPAVVLVGLAGEWIHGRGKFGKPVPSMKMD
ncbi:MAG: hypothetical protein V1748_13045 [Actinomycetota bacterium]